MTLRNYRIDYSGTWVVYVVAETEDEAWDEADMYMRGATEAGVIFRRIETSEIEEWL